MGLVLEIKYISIVTILNCNEIRDTKANETITEKQTNYFTI